MGKQTKTPPIDALVNRADQFARREPAKAVASAFGTGILLNLIPLGAIAAALTGIAFSLVRPVLLFLGLMKAVEFFSTKEEQTSNHHE